MILVVARQMIERWNYDLQTMRQMWPERLTPEKEWTGACLLIAACITANQLEYQLKTTSSPALIRR